MHLKKNEMAELKLLSFFFQSTDDGGERQKSGRKEFSIDESTARW